MQLLMAELTMEAMSAHYERIMSYADPRVAKWFMMSSPWPSIFLCIAYVLTVHWGQKVMRYREAFDVRSVMLVYNAAMVLLSGWCVAEFLLSGWATGYTIGCQPVDYSESPSAMRMARVCWWFYFSKFIELADTYFFVLRKKFNLITFLHVFHHAVMPASWWFGVKFVAGGFGTFHAMLNSFIHFLMYMYYFLAALGPKYQRYLWWKRYMTRAQILQFIVVTIHSMQLFFLQDCKYPVVFAWWILTYAVIFLGLFINFYVQAYLQKGKRQSAPPLKASNGNVEKTD